MPSLTTVLADPTRETGSRIKIQRVQVATKIGGGLGVFRIGKAPILRHDLFRVAYKKPLKFAERGPPVDSQFESHTEPRQTPSCH